MGESSGSSSSSSLVDSSWELVDPTPDIRALFMEFNDMFFWGKLAGCEVKWSPRMTLCAGQCHYEGRGGLCSVRLSVPLLKLRPRKDLIETLLHEMIHAYLFVTENNKDHDGHGPTFQSHMHRINGRTGTKISIYHSFHAEVAEYRQHWWRCDGCCRTRRPYFGWVKRASNRAPGPNDQWWTEHQRTCGGTYTKVKEPEGYKNPKTKEKKKKEEKPEAKEKTEVPLKDSNQRPITAFFGKGYVLGTSEPVSSDSKAIKNKGDSTSSDSPAAKKPKSVIPNADSDTNDILSVTVVKTAPCPVCTLRIAVTSINDHLDQCLAK